MLLSVADASNAAPNGISAEELRVSYGPQHNRQAHCHLDSLIENSWSAAVARNPRVFDGSKFRLQRIAWSNDGAKVELDLGLTSYKEYLGTNRLEPPLRLQLEKDGESTHGDRNAYLSNALGCETVLVTSDGQAVLLRRSGAVATHSGLYNGPSGHPEPAHAGVEEAGRPGHTLVPSTEDATGNEAEQRACQELFDSVLQEVHEETNVPREQLTPPRLIGCMADATGKPDLLFKTDTFLDAAGVRECYAQGAVEAWESDRLAFHPVDALGECPLPMTAVTRAAAACLMRMRSSAQRTEHA